MGRRREDSGTAPKLLGLFQRLDYSLFYLFIYLFIYFYFYNHYEYSLKFKLIFFSRQQCFGATLVKILDMLRVRCFGRIIMFGFKNDVTIGTTFQLLMRRVFETIRVSKKKIKKMPKISRFTAKVTNRTYYFSEFPH